MLIIEIMVGITIRDGGDIKDFSDAEKKPIGTHVTLNETGDLFMEGKCYRAERQERDTKVFLGQFNSLCSMSIIGR